MSENQETEPSEKQVVVSNINLEELSAAVNDLIEACTDFECPPTRYYECQNALLNLYRFKVPGHDEMVVPHPSQLPDKIFKVYASCSSMFIERMLMTSGILAQIDQHLKQAQSRIVVPGRDPRKL